MVLVQNDKGSGIKDAIITVDSTDETTKTNEIGKMTLSNAYKLKKTITIKATYNNKDEEKSITIEDNDGKDNEVTFTFNGKCRILKKVLNIEIFQFQTLQNWAHVRPEALRTWISIFTNLVFQISQRLLAK